MELVPKRLGQGKFKWDDCMNAWGCCHVILCSLIIGVCKTNFMHTEG